MAVAKACPFSNAANDFDPFDLTDPFPFYEYARNEAPVFFPPSVSAIGWLPAIPT